MPKRRNIDPAVVRARGSYGAHKSWAHTDDRAARTAPAREAFERRFIDEVDPDRTLPPTERARRASHARKAYYARLALKSAMARRAKAAADARASAGHDAA